MRGATSTSKIKHSNHHWNKRDFRLHEREAIHDFEYENAIVIKNSNPHTHTHRCVQCTHKFTFYTKQNVCTAKSKPLLSLRAEKKISEILCLVLHYVWLKNN